MEKQFLQAIIYYGEKIFEATVVDLEADNMDVDGNQEEGTSGAAATKKATNAPGTNR